VFFFFLYVADHPKYHV